MRKLAIFVEGQTEAIFVEKLLDEIAGKNKLYAQTVRLHGKLRTIDLRSTLEGQWHQYFVLIYDCEGGHNVKSDIRDNYEGLIAKGFDGIVGIRDVYPDFTYGELKKLRSQLRYGLKTNPIEVKLILCIMEIEAWFIAESTHFCRINPSLTLTHIETSFGFNPQVDDLELRVHPAEDLHNIYASVGLAYTKRRTNAMRTVNALDYERIYMVLREKSFDLSELLSCIDWFISLKP